MSRCRWAVVAMAALAWGSGCGNEHPKPDHPLVIVGFDGLEWSVAAPLVRAGEMPHLRSLIERGSSGYLYTEKPAKSPTVWTSVATGKRKKNHGVLDFADPRGVPYTSESRTGKALWNIASDYGLSTCVVGWWVTWPAEEINGVMVAPYSAAGQNHVNWKGNFYKDHPDQTWPRELMDELWPIAEEVSSRERLDEIAKLYFGEPDLGAMFQDLPDRKATAQRELVAKLIGQTRWSVAADETYLAMAKHLLPKQAEFPDLTMLYYGGPDVASHRFWQYLRPDEFEYEVHPDGVAAFAETINNFYRRADQILGDVLAMLPDDANVIVCSDHGFHSTSERAPSPIGISGHHQFAPPGMIVAAGPDIRVGFGADGILAETGKIKDFGWIYDVHPTSLYLLGLPVGRTIEQVNGGPLMRAVRPELLQARPMEHIPSHDEGFRLARPPRQVSEDATRVFHDWMDQLGYSVDHGAEDERSGPQDHAKDDDDP